jgi:hypothetical protein
LKATTRIAVTYSLVALAMVLAATPVVVYQITHPPRRGYSKNFCIAQLRQIEGAKNTWQLENQKTTNDVPADSDIFGTNQYIKIKPTCGLGGVYTLGRVGDHPKCSIPDHNR